MRDPTLHFSQIIDYNELNQREKNRNFKKIGFGRVKVRRFRFIFLLLVNYYEDFWCGCPDRSFKYLSFDIKMNSVGPIGAELWLFDLRGSSHLGQTLATHILDRIKSKNLIIWEYFFFMPYKQLTKFHQNRRWSCQILFWNWLIWHGMTQVIMLELSGVRNTT